MFKYVNAYLYKGGTVVLDKKHIRGAKDEDFEEVSLLLSDKFIKESAEELEFVLGDEEDFWYVVFQIKCEIEKGCINLEYKFYL